MREPKFLHLRRLEDKRGWYLLWRCPKYYYIVLSAGPCIVYGHFSALFSRPFCIALSANQILSAGPCIVYGRFPAVFVTALSCKARRHLSVPPLSALTCIAYGRFTALFGRPFCIALSANQILSAGPCIVYDRFPAVFVRVRSCVAWRHRSFPPLSAPTCIVYGHFTALFGRPFCIPLSPNQILSALTCISYGHFLALFGRFFCSIETSREPRRFTIAPSFEIVLTSQTIISKRAT